MSYKSLTTILFLFLGCPTTVLLPSLRRRGWPASATDAACPTCLASAQAQPSNITRHETDTSQKVSSRRHRIVNVDVRQIASRCIVITRRSNDVGERVFWRCVVLNEDRVGRSGRKSSIGVFMSAKPGCQWASSEQCTVCSHLYFLQILESHFLLLMFLLICCLVQNISEILKFHLLGMLQTEGIWLIDT